MDSIRASEAPDTGSIPVEATTLGRQLPTPANLRPDNARYLKGPGFIQSSIPFPSRILGMHLSILDSRVRDCLACEK